MLNQIKKKKKKRHGIIISRIFKCEQFVLMENVSKTSCKWFWMGRIASQLNKDSIKNYNEDSNKVYFLKLDFEYPKNLLNLHDDLPFLPERNKI